MKFNEVYKDAVDELNPSPELIYKIKAGKENKRMKFNRRKVAVAAAIACMAMGTTVYAAGHISSYISSSDVRNQNTDYSSTCEIAEEKGISTAIPETLSSGYSFEYSNVGDLKGLDDDGNTVAAGEQFVVTYAKPECPEISLFIEPVMEAVDYSSFRESKDILGTTVYYSRDTYKFVPADYELTEEDQKNMEQPNYYISYGSDKVEVQTCDNVIFEMDGKRYTLLGFDNDMTADEWYDMAGDLIQK